MSDAVLEGKLTPADVGRALRVTPRHARRLRGFPWTNIGTGKRPVLLCSRADFERWWSEQQRVA